MCVCECECAFPGAHMNVPKMSPRTTTLPIIKKDERSSPAHHHRDKEGKKTNAKMLSLEVVSRRSRSRVW